MPRGALAGIKVLEVGGIGPTPFACNLLADLGASVIRVQRPGATETRADQDEPPTIRLDLKTSDGALKLLTLVEHADVLIEGFRPGVAERLGIGPDVCSAKNTALIYARMTGWGQYGPLARRAGHDINYIGLTGALHAIGETGRRPVQPLNLLGDYGGGALYCVVGVISALYERTASGLGQTIDVAMVDGVSNLMSVTWDMYSRGTWSDARGANLLDGGAPFYDVYRCADDRYMAVGAIEPQFYAKLSEILGVELPPQDDTSRWDEMRSVLTDAFARQPREAWTERFKDVDACVSPVLSLSEAPFNAHLQARDALVLREGNLVQSGLAPRFSRTQGSRRPEHADLLAAWGIDLSEMLAS